MITYNLWKTLRQKGISQNKLIHHYGFSPGALDRMRKNKYISTHTVDVLCTILECRVEDIIEFQMDPAFRPEMGIIPGKTPLTAPPGKLPDGTRLSAPADPGSELPEEDTGGHQADHSGKAFN